MDKTRKPLCSKEDLGKPLPPSPHAVSVAFPKWQDVIGYEEGNERVISALQTAYPRFFLHKKIVELFSECEKNFAGKGEFCFAFPSSEVARRCLDYVKKISGIKGRSTTHYDNKIHVVTFPKEAYETVKNFWQNVGFIISSRFAESLLSGREPSSGEQEKTTIKQHIAALSEQNTGDVYLFPSGMASIFTAHRLLSLVSPKCKTIQLGFPYVDSLKIQEKFGSGVHFIKSTDGNYLQEIETTLGQEKISGLFCEFPSNPLLKSADIPALSKILRAHGVPLIIDDTVSSWHNVDFKEYFDIKVTSLTKFFSGSSDVLAGSLIINRQSPFYEELKNKIESAYEDLLFGADAIVLAKNSADFEDRIKKINKTAEKLCDFLASHPKIKEIYYPKYIDEEIYSRIKKYGAGYGGLFSILFKNSPDAPVFYDNLRIDKGPSLGTNFTIACPYTLLAHYNELDFAKECGVSADLIRVSVGLENEDDLINRFKEALGYL